MRHVVLLLISCLSVAKLYAQSFDKSSEGLRAFVKDFYENKVNNLKKTKNVQGIQQHIAPVFNGKEVNVDLDGGVQILKLSRSFILNRVETYMAFKDLEVMYSIHKFYAARIISNVGIAEFELKYKLREGKITVSEGTMNMNLIAKHDGEKWLIAYINDLGIDELKVRGECYCQIYSKGKTKAFATLLYPDGDQYTEEMYNVKIGEPFDYSVIPVTIPFDILTSSRTYVYKFTFNNDDVYHWYSKTGEVYKDKKSIGNARSQNKVIRKILMFKHKESCRLLKLKKMK